jgi:hypothetical protein
LYLPYSGFLAIVTVSCRIDFGFGLRFEKGINPTTAIMARPINEMIIIGFLPFIIVPL